MPTNNTVIRVAIYARVSTSEQAEHGTSIENQTEQLRAYCKAQGWEITQEYVDAGFSGKDDNRPDLQRMMSDAKAGLFTKIVVYKLDRLYRNLRLLLGLKEDLTKANVILISIKESIDTSGLTGRMTFQVLGMVSEWERESIADRMKSGRLQRYRQGCWASGYAAYGYQYNKDTRKLEIDASEAVIVRRIYTEYATGKSLNAIANGLNIDNIRPKNKQGLGWRANAIRLTLINPMYKGQQILNRNMSIAYIDKVDESKVIRVSVPRIVNDNIWNEAQRRLDANKHVKPMKKEPWLLQGRVFCGLCGRTYKATKNGRNKYYVCRGTLKVNHMDGSPRCQQRMLRSDWLEAQVLKETTSMLSDPNRLFGLIEDTIANLTNKEQELSARIQPVEAKLKDIAEKKMKLADDWVKASLPPEKFKELQRQLDTEEARLKAIKGQEDPSQLSELERVRGVIGFWKQRMQELSWNTTDEDGNLVGNSGKPLNYILTILGLEDIEVSNILAFPATRKEFFDRLKLRLVVYPDRIEAEPHFTISLGDCQNGSFVKGD